MTLLTTSDRSYAGFTATIVDLDTGALEVTTRQGYMYVTYEDGRQGAVTSHLLGNRELLEQLCAELRQRPGQWRIRSISTPDTILTDLKGRKPHLARHRYPEHPETQMLGTIGQIDMLEENRASEDAAA